eukprot:TRINITY_DN4497_c0_g1_i1.p1 TRINITY_DN4497_c0_g1~~TRINITY_DN4497_c0_g1_i1.p1  ORF type:complete len:465 (-),score=89.90 TRINITY_DN4497_c0_g1_i1:109-1338(-)
MESSLEKNLREATSDKHYGCPNSVLYDLAQSACNYHHRQKIMAMVREKLNSTADRWCRILKTLTLVEYLVKNGPHEAVSDVRCELRLIQRFLHFSFYEGGKERGGGVVEKAKVVVNLFSDEEVLRSEREKAQEHRTKIMNASCVVASGGNACTKRQQQHHLSKTSFDRRFNELKEKQEQQRASREEQFEEKARPDHSTADSRNHNDDGEVRRRASSSSEEEVGCRTPRSDNADTCGRRQGDTNGSSSLDLFDGDVSKPISSETPLGDRDVCEQVGSSEKVPAAQVDLLDMLDDEFAVAPGNAGSISASLPAQETWSAFDAAPAAPAPTAPVQEAWAAFDAAPTAQVPSAPIQEAWAAFDASPAAPAATAPSQEAWPAFDAAPAALVPPPPVQAPKSPSACPTKDIFDLL